MSLRRPTAACLLFIYSYISLLCGVAQTPDCGMFVIYLFFISPLCGVAQTPDCGIVNLFATFRGVISDTRSVHSIFTPVLYVHIFSACVHHRFSWQTLWSWIFRSMIIPCYIIPVFLMFASTFKRTHWLVPGYCLGQISCVDRRLRRQPWNPYKGDSSLAKIGVILVSCSCGKWSPIDAYEPQTASAINH